MTPSARRELESQAFARSRVTHQLPFGAVLYFENPDGTALEFYYLPPNTIPAK